MGYSIIFQTKIAKLPDGRIIHFDRSGCNNDAEGRVKGEFTDTIYTEEEFIKRAEGFMEDSKPYKDTQQFDLKIFFTLCKLLRLWKAFIKNVKTCRGY